MPVTDGFEAAASIRPLLDASACLIAVSGNPDVVRLAKGGLLFDHAHLKPLSVALLLRLIRPSGDEASFR